MGLYCRMVVIHRAYGFRFVIYTSDHEPAHIHIAGPGRAKVNLIGKGGGPELVASIGIKRNEMRRLMLEIVEHRDVFWREWERIHGRAN